MNNQCVQDINQIIIIYNSCKKEDIFNRRTTRGASFHSEGEMIYEINKIANN